MSSTPPDAAPEGPKSPKHLAFVIDFGDSKSFDNQRHKALVEKFQNRHKRGQSLSKLDELPPKAVTVSCSKRQTSSGSLRRKNSFQSEGYFSCDERSEHLKNNGCNSNVQHSRLREDLRLPLRNTNSDKMTQSYPNGSFTLSSINSLEVELQDVSSPEFDLVSPFSPQKNEPITPNFQGRECLQALPNSQFQALGGNVESNCNNQFVDGLDFDFDKSNTPSESGTYTLDTDNYTEEQKARMSIDKDFNIEQVSGKQRVEEYVKSLSNRETVDRFNKSKTCSSTPAINQKSTRIDKLESPVCPPLVSKRLQEHRTKILSPILSPTQNISITDKVIYSDNSGFTKSTKSIYEHKRDEGSVTSITASGAFGRKSNAKTVYFTKTGLSQSQVETQMYIDFAHKNNNTVSVQESPILEHKHNTNNELMSSDQTLLRLSTLPPTVGGGSGKCSPTKIPSPVHSAFSRPRSRNSFADSDSSLETEAFLKPTQNYINTLQKRLSIDNDPDEFQKCNIRLNNDVQKMAHIRHNSYDDKNLQVSNKLEHFQNKSLQGIDQTFINKFNQFSHPVHKIHNSPNHSPIQRSSSFSSTKNQITNIQQKVSNITISSVAKQNNLRGSPMLDQNNSPKPPNTLQSYILRSNRTSVTPERLFGDTESSSEEDFDKNSLRRKDLSNLTNTRYNRAFALRRARLEEPPVVPKCPNTPEMRRKFQTSEHIHSERAVSVDRRPVKTNNVSSRYLQSASKVKLTERVDVTKNVPKYPNEKSQILSRTDSGRFSMRATNKPNISSKQKNTIKEPAGKKPSGGRSNSSLSSREVEFQNWKRRKSYDPMKAAAQGKKKNELSRKQGPDPMTQSYNDNQQNQSCDSSPSHSSSVHRSQSFHGTAALTQLISSEEEDDLTLSADEGFSPPTPSPYKLNPARVLPRQAWRDQLLD